MRINLGPAVYNVTMHRAIYKAVPLILFVAAFTLTGCWGFNPRKIHTLEPLSADEWLEIEVDDHTDLDEVTFLVIGDMGEGDENQFQVGAAMADYCSTNNCDFVLGLGDNIYGDGVNSEHARKFQTKFEQPYDVMGRIDFWMIPGNHDWHLANSVQSQINYSARSDRWRMPYLNFEVPNLPKWLNIYAIDTTVSTYSIWRPNDPEVDIKVEEMIAEAAQSLCGKPGWRIMFGHHPRYSSGKHAMSEDPTGILTAMDQSMGATMEECDVQVYFSGHDHHQEIISLEDGFVQIIQGAGGRHLREIPNPDADLVGDRWLSERFGFGAVTINADQMYIEFFGLDDSAELLSLCAWTLHINGEIEAENAKCALK